MPVTIHNNETLKGVAIRLEEHVFINCKLINCSVFYDGGPFQWTNTFFDNCQFSFRDAAMNTIRVLQTLGMLKEGPTPPPLVSESSTVN
jgi:hypothetical protein